MAIEIFDATMNNIEKAMGAASKIQEVSAHNIANAKTPGYEAVEFDEALNKAVKRLEKKDVSVEEEMAQMAKNTQRFSTFSKLLSSKLAVLRSVVTQGRR
ncbi:MAG: flagellar basal body protein [Candidatus Margulisiibacteriota bacterium]